jgi:hypothetical protein
MVIEIVSLLVCTIYIFLLALSIQTLEEKHRIPDSNGELEKRHLEESSMPESIYLKYERFFENYPSHIWGNKTSQLNTEAKIYDYINTHMIPITPTKAGLVSDMQQAIVNERKYKGGLAWFAMNKFASVSDVHEALFNLNILFGKYFRRRDTNDHDVVQRGLDEMNRKLDFFIKVDLMKPIVLEGQETEGVVVASNANVFHDYLISLDATEKLYKETCEKLDSLKTTVENISILMGIYLTNRVEYDCQQKDAEQYLKYKKYWSIVQNIDAEKTLEDILKFYKDNNLTVLIKYTENYYKRYQHVTAIIDISFSTTVQRKFYLTLGELKKLILYK